MKLWRKILIAVLVCIIVYSGVKLFEIYSEYEEAEKIYEESREDLFHIEPEPDETEKPAPVSTPQGDDNDVAEVPAEEVDFPHVKVDFDRMAEINSQIIGWIYIPGTKVSYPMVKAGDNAKYLYMSYNFINNSSGSIFADYRNSSDMTDLNTVIYGHNMKNGSMFGSLKKYISKDYLEDHKYMYIYTPAATYRYEIYSAYTTPATGTTYTLSFGETSFSQFAKHTVRNSAVKTGMEVEDGDRVVTLSTCTSTSDDTRFVVHAVLVDTEVIDQELFEQAEGGSSEDGSEPR